MNKKTNAFLALVVVLFFISCAPDRVTKWDENKMLVFDQLAQVWDEAVPLGNGMVGSLIWQKDGKLRFSLDRADLWDLRPMENIDFEKWKFQNVYEHWKADKYEEVQKAFDVPYNRLPAPSKIPAGALEFDIEALGIVKTVSLNVENALCVVEWQSGVKLTTFVHAEKSAGWYKFENIDQPVKVELISPAYNRESDGEYTAQSKNDLNQLGYPQGEIKQGDKSYTYNQKGWGEFAYQIHTQWDAGADSMVGSWSDHQKMKVGM